MKNEIYGVREAITNITQALFEKAEELNVKYGTADILVILSSMTDSEFERISAYSGSLRMIYYEVMRVPENRVILDLSYLEFASRLKT